MSGLMTSHGPIEPSRVVLEPTFDIVETPAIPEPWVGVACVGLVAFVVGVICGALLACHFA
jgi:hypothetical protein